MSRHIDSAGGVSLTEDPVEHFLSLIESSEGLPEVMSLAKVLLASWSRQPGVKAAAVATDHVGSILLDPACRSRSESWLVTTKSMAASRNSTSWVPMHGSWASLTANYESCLDGETLILQGTDPHPGGEPWTEAGRGFEPVSCTGWLAAPVTVRGQMKFVLLLGMEADPQLVSSTHDSLVRLVKALSPLVAVWSEALALNARLRQVDEENMALGRLNRLQGRFVAMAGHEFKAPLTSITAYSDVLGKQLMDGDLSHTEEFLGVIRNESGRLLRMVNRILDFTRMGNDSRLLSLKPVAMEPLVRDTIHTLGPKIQHKNLMVEVEAPADLPRAEVDPDLIRQVLLNLLHNAVKFAPSGGEITVRLEEKESAVAVSVQDNGPGIPPEDIRRIFREYYRADCGTAAEEGTGLGLAIARHIVNLHGGHIEAERRPEGGSDFRFLVPKETGSMAPLGEVLRRPVDPQEGTQLVENLLFLLAEMTGSRTVIMLLRDGNGALVPVGAIGLELDTAKPLPLIENQGWTRFFDLGQAVTDPGPKVGDLSWCPSSNARIGGRMYAPIGVGESALGCVIMGRRRGLETYDQADLIQLSVLSEIVHAALKEPEEGLAGTTSTVRLLLKIRRNGVPTVTPQSLALADKLGSSLGLNQTQVKELLLAAVLHDAGMAQVEEEIVFGETELSLDERDEVNRHVDQIVDLLGPLLPDGSTEKIIRHHHERFDGTGYPAGLRGQDIPLGSRLLAVIDTWFSLTSPRPFRSGLSAAEAHEEILAHAGTQFDKEIVAEFTQVLLNEGILKEAPAAAGPVGSGSRGET